ncbi:hypothetical protein ACQZV8_00420 [Magnetococcales bacterium HHB-1]
MNHATENRFDGLQFFHTTQIDPSSKGFSGAIFDGHYVYFIPLNNGQPFGQITRYDTLRPYHEKTSWSLIDSARFNPQSCGFTDGLFDGRYLYMVPFFNGQHHGQVTRFDTQSSPEDPQSWQFFDSTKYNQNSRGFVSGTFDGRYIYLAPYQLDWSTHHGTTTRYDTQRDFLDPQSWQFFDAQQHHPQSQGFHCATYDDDFVYFIPYLANNRQFNGQLTRYNRHQPFTNKESWQSFDLTKINPGCVGYIGATVVQKKLYLVPYYDGTDRHGRALRYNGGPFDHPESWQYFDLRAVHKNSRGFFGALFDQRYLYYIPHCIEEGIYHGQASRFDTTKPFDDPKSWRICNTEEAFEESKGYIGGVVAGEYLYMTPYETGPKQHTGTVARFHLKDNALWK